MKGYDIFSRAIVMLGHLEHRSDSEASKRLMPIATEVINQIAVDLKCCPISALSNMVDLPVYKQEAMIYGVAMMFSLIEGETELNRFFTDIYNFKRSSALSENISVKDNIPTVDMG